MFTGSIEDRRAIFKAGEIIGEMSKWTFISLCYLGVVVGVSIKVGSSTVKTVKMYVSKAKRKEGEECL